MATLINILIADDQFYLQEVVAQGLAGDNYHVASLRDGNSLRGYLDNSKPDLVLLEPSLNGFEGWEVLHYIKTKDPLLPVLIVTAYDSYADDPRASEADGYIVKNFAQFDELKERIAEVLNRKVLSRLPPQ